MLDHLREENILFLDIETVPLAYQFDELDATMQRLWDKKTRYLQKEELTAADVYEKAGIYAEFGKIICISVGVLRHESGEAVFRIKSFFGDDEKQVLEDFAELLRTNFSSSAYYLCAHNGKEFDFPFIARRMLINGLRLPDILQLAGKKPWEVTHLDTMSLWKFGDYKHFTSLDLLTTIFNIPTPKSDIDGSDVARVYYEEKNLQRIVDYCQNDVLAVAQLFLKFKGKPLIKEANISIAAT